jgi:hypothetical protein
MYYLLPLKAAPEDDLRELGDYVRELTQHLRVLVVDGSDETSFTAHAALFGGARHVRPDPRQACANGKVAGVRTGFTLCPDDTVVIADDDVRYRPEQLRALERLLREADLVSPQNVYEPMTWTAWLDTARMLLNRTLPSGDFPGTLALRLTDELRSTGYDGAVLFENLELIRTVRAAGGRVLAARGVFVARRPPTGRHFLGQRIRQAYDSQAQPLRCAAELALAPLFVAGLRRPRLLAALVGAVLAAAECGRRRAGGRAHFPAAAVLLAPVWLSERAVCSWLALGQRVLLGGTRYSSGRIRIAASSPRQLRAQRHASRSCGCRRSTASAPSGRTGTTPRSAG